MKNITFILLSLALVFNGCKKDDTDPNSPGGGGGGGNNQLPCEINNTAKILISNSSNHPYAIYINNSTKGTASAGRITTFEHAAGGWTIKAVQISGYALYPTERNTSLTPAKCSEWSWQIP